MVNYQFKLTFFFPNYFYFIFVRVKENFYEKKNYKKSFEKFAGIKEVIKKVFQKIVFLLYLVIGSSKMTNFSKTLSSPAFIR